MITKQLFLKNCKIILKFTFNHLISVLDMLRFHKFTIGHAWVSEYGSSDEEEHFNNLIRYSPLHNIPESASRYPAILLLTGLLND